MSVLPFLQKFSVPFNEMKGTVPTEFVETGHLVSLELHGNLLVGTIPEVYFDKSFSQLLVLNVGDNALSGTLSTNVGNLADLKGLHVFQNNLGGEFPSEIGKLDDLLFMRANGNQFNGTVPVEIGNLRSLGEFWFDENQFTGTIPSELAQMTRMTDFRLSENNLVGSIPEEFYGSFPRLLIFDVIENELVGTLSSSVSNWQFLQQLRVSRNRLSGPIPASIQTMEKLQLAWLHLNDFSGSLLIAILAFVWTRNLPPHEWFRSNILNNRQAFDYQKENHIIVCVL